MMFFNFTVSKIDGVFRKFKFLSVFLFFIIASFSVFCGDNESDADFYFVQISDTHFDGGENSRRTEAAVNAINKLPMKIEFVALTGDIMADNVLNENIAKQASEILAKIKAPLSLLPGNHDILPKKLQQTLLLYKKYFGELSHKKEVEGVVMLFIYTEPIRKNFQVEAYDPWQVLENELASAKEKPIIIFHHAPTPEDFYNNALHESWPAEARERWDKLINSFNVKGVIAGHFHRDEYHWSGNVPTFVGESIAHYWGRQAAYRIYHYKNGRLGYSTQYIESLPPPPLQNDK
jgi:Icc-related predicted phosphoesterase